MQKRSTSTAQEFWIVTRYLRGIAKSEVVYRSPGTLPGAGVRRTCRSPGAYPLSKACFFSNSARAVRAADSNCSARSINAGCAVA
jgi:hypothetical protein